MFEKEAEERITEQYGTSGEYITRQRIWQDGAEFGYNKAKEEGKVVVEHFEAYGQCRDSRRIASLEKENDELKKECRRCVHTDCSCILSDYGKDRNGICDHFKDVFDENIELKKACDETQELLDKQIEATYKLDKENAELKEQNNKAKEIVRSLYFIIQGRIDYENNIAIADEMWRAKQFWKELE